MTDRCPWCGQPARMEFVRGHYECSTCRRPIMDCCDGEQACPVEAKLCVRLSERILTD